jgi:hypothetical protein
VRPRLEHARRTGDPEPLRAVVDEFDRMGARRSADRARTVSRQLDVRVGHLQDRSELTSRSADLDQVAPTGT